MVLSMVLINELNIKAVFEKHGWKVSDSTNLTDSIELASMLIENLEDLDKILENAQNIFTNMISDTSLQLPDKIFEFDKIKPIKIENKNCYEVWGVYKWGEWKDNTYE